MSVDHDVITCGHVRKIRRTMTPNDVGDGRPPMADAGAPRRSYPAALLPRGAHGAHSKIETGRPTTGHSLRVNNLVNFIQ